MSDLLEQLVASLLPSSILLQVDTNLFQTSLSTTGKKQREHMLLTSCEIKIGHASEENVRSFLILRCLLYRRYCCRQNSSCLVLTQYSRRRIATKMWRDPDKYLKQ